MRRPASPVNEEACSLHKVLRRASPTARADSEMSPQPAAVFLRPVSIGSPRLIENADGCGSEARGRGEEEARRRGAPVAVPRRNAEGW